MRKSGVKDSKLRDYFRKNKKLCSMLIIILLLFFILIILSIRSSGKAYSNIDTSKLDIASKQDSTGSFSSSKVSDCDDYLDYDYKGETSENIIKNISVEKIFKYDNYLIVTLKNNNKRLTDINYKIDFFDENNQIVKTIEGKKFRITTSNTVYIRENIYGVNYKKYEFKITTAEDDGKYFCDNSKSLKTKLKDDGKNYSVSITNTNDDNVSGTICLKYKFDSNVVNVQCNVFDVDSNSTKSIKFDSYYFDQKYEGLVFNNVEASFNTILYSRKRGK